MPKYRKLSSKDVEKILIKHGFKFVSQKGSHRQFKGIIKGRKRRVTVLADRKSFHFRKIGRDEAVEYIEKLRKAAEIERLSPSTNILSNIRSIGCLSKLKDDKGLFFQEKLKFKIKFLLKKELKEQWNG